MTDDQRRFTDPVAAVDHVRRLARETAAVSGYQAAAAAVRDLRQEYRIMPLARREAGSERLAAWDAVRLETRSLAPMAMGGTEEHALFDERTATPADQPLPQQPGWVKEPATGLQAAALRTPATASLRPPVTSSDTTVSRAPGR